MRKRIICREELLDRARDIIREDDLEACTIRELANRAGIAVGTVYNYFPSLENLLQAVFLRSWHITLERLKNGSIPEDPEKAFLRFYAILKEDITDRKGIGSKVFKSEGFKSGDDPWSSPIFGELGEMLEDMMKRFPEAADWPQEKLKRHSRWLLMLTADSIMQEGQGREPFREELARLFLASLR